MIRYKKLNKLQADVIIEGKVVGYIEKTIGGYIVEVNYIQRMIPQAQKEGITRYINNLHYRLKAREIKVSKKLRDYKQFKIIG